MKQFRNIVLFTALILSQWIGAAGLTSADPYWLGASSGYGTTEGNDFWLTFMNNATISPETYPDVTFELKIAVSARQQTHIIIEIDGQIVHDHTVNANETYLYDLKDMYAQIYLQESEVMKYKGVRVYTDEKNKLFSCFNYSRNGEAGESSRDATLIIPSKFMGKEYFVQTYYEDNFSSEFAIVATEDNTSVTITPNYLTYGGHAQGQSFTIELQKRGDAYLVASALHMGNNVKVDLSGSQICADKPIAVFNGNQQTSIPYHESNSKDYLSEQILPITQWGTEFYLAKFEYTVENYTIFTAAYDGTHIELECYIPGTNSVQTITRDLNKGESTKPLPITSNGTSEIVVHSNQPVMCYTYTTSGGQNKVCSGDIFDQVCVMYGDPANALMPSWAHRAKSMNFFTHDLDPYVAPGTEEAPKKYFVYLVTKTADINKITIDGVGGHGAKFKPFLHDASAEMSYACIEVTNPSTHYHLVETTGDGFVGNVYAVTDAQGYLYTLGYSPEPFRDSLFVANTENVMSPKSYDVQPRLEQGWYQRQWEEWATNHERIDTAQICDGDSIAWLLQSAISKQTEPVDWYIYDVTGTEQTIHKSYTAPIAQKEGATKDEATNTDWLYRWGHKFVLPDESDLPPEERTPFMEYEIQAVMHQKHVICNLPDDLDTIRTVVRVTRVYHDTIYKIICMGDTLKCFNDSLPHQNAHNNDPSYLDDLPQYRTNSKSETLFIGDKRAGNATQDFTWKAGLGENSFTRHYETIYGCDSTYTLFLFVCDTFRTIDTIHLCKNEAVTYLDDNPSLQKKYKGVEYEGNGTLVTQDTVDIIRTKTRFCPCQLAPYSNNYPAFEGCDSIFEVHIFLHEVPRDTLVDTMCYNRNPDSVYIWPIQKGTDEIRITKSHPRMTYDAGLRAWIGFFSDTLRTTTCPACNEGKGCDSINVLKLYIPEPFYEEKEDSICQWSYDKQTRLQTTNVYQWEGHRKGSAYVELPRGGVYYDSCLTRFGCDSIYQLKLHYTQPFLHVDFASIANNQTYTWHGMTYGPFPELKDVEDTTLYFHNDNELQVNPVNGCDSIYRLDLHISDTYLFRSTRSICDIDSIHWRDTIIVGSKWQGTGSFDIRLADSLTTIIDDSLVTVALPARDSIYRLTVTQYPTYDTTLQRVNLCQDQTVYNWVREDDGTLIQRITLPIKTSYPFDTLYTDTLPTRTPHACDSILHLPIRIYPTYDTTTTVVLCEAELPYTWELRDANNHDKTINIPDADRGSLWHHTEAFTLITINGCDSIVHLDLTVKPTIRHTIPLSFCPETMPYTYGVHGKQASVSGVYNDTTTSVQYGCDSITTYDITVYDKIEVHVSKTICDDRIPYTYEENDTVPVWQGLTVTGDYPYVFHRSGLCDSTVILHLTVNPVHRDTLDIRVCQNTDGYYYKNLNNGAGGTLPARYLSDSLTRVDTIETALGCDSIITLHYYVDSVYSYTRKDTVCQQIGGQWTWYEDGVSQGSILLDKGDTTWLLGTKYSTIHGCDSTYGIEIYVAPVYHVYDTITLCEKDSLQWQKMLFVGNEYANYGKTYDATPFDSAKLNMTEGSYDYTIKRQTILGCDSVHHLHLTVSPVRRVTIERRTCQNTTGYYYESLNNGSGGTLPARYLRDSLTRMDTINTVLGCDSIITLHYYVDSVYSYTRKDTVCQQIGGQWTWYEDGVPQSSIPLDKGDTTWLLGTKYSTIHGCDSTYGIEVYVAPIYHIYDTVILCENDSAHWQGMLFTGSEYANYGRTYTETDFDSIKTGLAANNYDFSIRRGTKLFDCDSVHHLHLTVNPVRRVTIERRTCQNTTGYYYESLHNGSGGTLPARYLRDSLTRMDTINTVLGCDSIITLHYYVDSVYSYTRKDTVCQQIGGEWTWYEDGVPQLTITLDKGDTTWFLGTKYSTIHGCDSTYGIEVYVAPIYHIYDTVILCENDSAHWQGMLFTGSEYANYGRTYTETDFDSIKTGLAANNYDFSIRRGTKFFDCDSVHHLHLTVNPVRRVTIERRTCQNTTGYYYESLHNGSGGTLPARYLRDSLTRMDTINTVLGCDSIITLHYYVDSVYDYRQTLAVCQDTINSRWEWIDDEGHSHGFINIADSGNFSFDETHTTIHGCDSLYGLKLRVKPIYRFDSAYVICENEQLVWQGRTYSGLSVGMHYDTARYTTYEDCDSIFYMQVLVHPIFDTTSYFSTCANDTYIWHQQDHNGTYHHTVWNSAQIDTVFLTADEAEAPAAEVPHLKYQKDTMMIYRDTMLQTIHGCDSLSRLWLTVQPAYFFYTDSTICSSERITYRGKVFPSKESKDTTYTEILKTADGCDSIYQLHLHIKPAYLYTRIREICDNETLIFPEDGRKVWEPGDPLPQPKDYIDFSYTTYEGCDSTYRYFVTVHPTYYEEREETFCSADSVLIQGSHYVGLDTLYDVFTCQFPVDTVFTDSLNTIYGCDSVFRIKAHILPQYHHIDADTICDDGSVTWRGRLFENLSAGDHVAFDSLLTKAGCDSVYELRLRVTPTYYFEERITKCADEDLTWREHNLDHHEVGDFLIYDSLRTAHYGCDSVYHLYLTVLDTTTETIYDTICRSEQYDFHGDMLTTPGYYYDTTLNAWGCHHFTHLFLEVIEPTVPTAWADSICADDMAYELYYTYTGDFDPVAYSVYYDEVGHHYGFEDIEDMPITTLEELSVLTLPMPLREGDKTKYPKPDYYPIRLVLDNGICTTPELCDTDTSIVLSYPSWITEQRFGDVIALYNDRYNGGYQWDEFQWYHGDEIMVGETHEYLYVPTGLIVGDQYHVRLTRTGETTDFQTCPITIVGDPVSDDFSPKKGYLSVVPTCIVTGHPYANILSRKDGMYRVTSSEGRLVKEGVFRADVTEIELPSVSGIYIFQLWSPDTPEEPYRAIKVIVKEKCEGCNISF